MKNLLLIIIFLATPFISFSQDNLIKKVDKNTNDDKKTKFKFTTIVDAEATSIKNQGRSGTCWSYSGNSFLESEIIRNGGNPIDIAEMYTVRKVYSDKADNYVRMHKFLNFGQGGALHDPIDMMGKYGLVPQGIYPGLIGDYDINRHGEMEGILKGMLDAVVENKDRRLSNRWKLAFEKVLDVYLGDDIKKFNYKGVEYTPKSFAKNVAKLDASDYVEVTSFTHHPFYEKMTVRVPDNWSLGQSYNIKMNEMVGIVDNALKNGYTVSWATDVSEKGFSRKKGLAIVPEKDYSKMSEEEKNSRFDSPKKEKTITQKLRQTEYDNFLTQDDHGMHIVGIAKDQNGKEYYLVKNSWGDKYNKGFIYASKAFFKLKTISILLNKKGIPKNIKRKLNL